LRKNVAGEKEGIREAYAGEVGGARAQKNDRRCRWGTETFKKLKEDVGSLAPGRREKYITVRKNVLTRLNSHANEGERRAFWLDRFE